jgi:competence ComEA-like helix-hairpin-helix protein
MVTAWPPSAQLTTAFLLGVALTLLAVHICGSWRWGSRPSELQQGALTLPRTDLNRAERAELLQLPGVGSGLAERIETYRREQGPFRRVDDLAAVPGVGPSTLERLRPLVYVGPEAAGKGSPCRFREAFPFFPEECIPGGRFRGPTVPRKEGAEPG